MFPFVRLSFGFAMLLTCAVAAFAAGCGGSQGPAREPIAGSVSIGGKPLAKGRILFLPVAPNQGPAVAASIVDGRYSLSRREGPIVGANRVEVEAELDLGFALDDEAAFARRGGAPLPPNPVPPAFNRNSTLVCQVRAGEDNQFDVAIPPAAHVTARPSY
jgi:hypothetical protein